MSRTVDTEKMTIDQCAEELKNTLYAAISYALQTGKPAEFELDLSRGKTVRIVVTAEDTKVDINVN